MAAIVIVVVVVLFGAVLGGCTVSTLNKENGIRQTILTKQKDNKSQMDAMWKTIEQTAQVSKAQKDALVEIYSGYANARAGGGAGDTDRRLMTWVKEAVPNANPDTFRTLQNIIVSQREGFAMRQKELLDLSREHNTILGNIVEGTVCKMFGRNAIEVTIVTSSRTENAFETGKDDNTTLPLK